MESVMYGWKNWLKTGVRLLAAILWVMAAVEGEDRFLYAQEYTSESELEQLDSSTYQNNTLYLPIFGSTPETGLMLGALVAPRFKIGGAGPDTRSSSVFFSGIYTLKSQIMASFSADLIFPEEKWILNSQIYGAYFPDRFWGVGASVNKADEVKMLFTAMNLEQTVLKKVGSHLFAGPIFRITTIRDIRFSSLDGEDFASPQLRGVDGSRTIGAGFVIRHDRRNSNITPTEHHFFEITYLANPAVLGTDHSYYALLTDGRKYFDFGTGGSSVLAFQGLVRLTGGKPAFTELSTMGGERIGRGYYSGMYRSQNSAQVQGELRQHLFSRIGISLFAAGGEVWDRFDELSSGGIKWSAGAGIRFNMNEEETTNIRADFGIGKNTTGFYLSFGEAF